MPLTRRPFIVLGIVAATGLPGCASMSDESTPAFLLTMGDGTKLFVRRWLAVSGPPKGVVQIVHGSAEHSARYDRIARHLNREGWLVYADDHRGHGHTRVRSGALGDAGPDAWNKFVSDEKALNEYIASQHPGVNVFMLGHSMGSFIAQDYAARHGTTLAGVVLSGSNGMLPDADETVTAARDLARTNPMGSSALLASAFEAFNGPFAGQPGFDWLSRDRVEVEKYQNDPACGFVFNNELVADFLAGLRELWNPVNEARIPKNLPFYVVAGARDPVSGYTAGLQVLLANYRRRGMTDISYKFYPDARHEILNEINRDEVEADIMAWLDARRD